MTYFVHAENFAEASENRIHSDDVAQKLGFRGALVPGVTVYGYLVHPLVERFGGQWLEHSVADLRLIKPTYDGERVRVELDEGVQGHTVRAYDESDVLTATLASTMPAELPPAPDAALFEGPIKHPERVEIGWSTVSEGAVFAPWTVTFTPEDNARYTLQAKDAGEPWHELVHPHWLLALANTALVNEYVMPAWIHVGSETRHRAALRIGDAIVVRSAIVEKWRRKGHEFVGLHVTFWRDDVMTTDILHTAIFKVAG